jgi:hypothetical protein
MKKIWWLSCFFCGALASGALGDQLMVTGQTKDGTFEGYSDGRFHFQTTKFKSIKEQAIRVSKLVLSQPLTVAYMTSDGKELESAVLKGYDKRLFSFQKDGNDFTIPQAKMKSIEPTTEENGNGGGGGGGDSGDPSKYPIPEVDLSIFDGMDLTPAQQATLTKFKTSKMTYDAFYDKNTAMVKEMDHLTGAKRIDLLNQLRLRKGDEQPLRKDLIAAYKALAAAFPQPAEEPAK